MDTLILIYCLSFSVYLIGLRIANQIHLIEDENWQPVELNAQKWGRNPHLALAVDDLEAMKARLTEKGYPFQSSSSGRAALFTKDPDGNIIELRRDSP